MNIDTIYKLSIRKLSEAKSDGEIQRVVSAFDREFEEHLKHLNEDYAKHERCMKEELNRQEREFETRMEALRAEREAIDKEIESVLGLIA